MVSLVWWSLGTDLFLLKLIKVCQKYMCIWSFKTGCFQWLWSLKIHCIASGTLHLRHRMSFSLLLYSLTCTVISDLGQVCLRVKGYCLVTGVVAGHVAFATVDAHLLQNITVMVN